MSGGRLLQGLVSQPVAMARLLAGEATLEAVRFEDRYDDMLDQREELWFPHVWLTYRR